MREIPAVLCLYVTAAMICGGLVMYPIGWDNQERIKLYLNGGTTETSPAAKQKFIGQREDRFRVDDDLSTVCTFQANAHCPGPAISSSVRQNERIPLVKSILTKPPLALVHSVA
uniref:Uncharacterized protein n=1 Tax=Vespula pensylvanica TaxID=30213 RepID=A0A834UEZ5_VESPE|nr:hypothetical protein H0235_003740 [Vespula pensylvanica]